MKNIHGGGGAHSAPQAPNCKITHAYITIGNSIL